jgi:hypothetical protein
VGFAMRPVTGTVHASVGGGGGFRVSRAIGPDHLKLEFDTVGGRAQPPTPRPPHTLTRTHAYARMRLHTSARFK